MTEIHRTAQDGFTAGARMYAAGRPDYPRKIQSWLVDELELRTGKTALDLAAGTGKFTFYLLATGATVVAVEPVDAMREQLLQRFPGMDARIGSAQHIPLDDESVDAVVCAQAFHWFATAEAVREIGRVLRPGGSFGLVWNVRDDEVPWVREMGRIMKPFEGDAPRFSSQQWRKVFPAAGFGALRETEFAHSHVGPPEKVIVERILSVSFMAALPRDEQQKVAERLRAVIAEYPELRGKEEVSFPYRTLACVCRKL
jgi:ubiquinone/menaquinone biosynthesis C-methylase UbiE